MEYLDGFEVMKKQLISGKVDKVAAQKLARIMAVIHSATHKDNLSEEEFQALKDTFKLAQNLSFLSVRLEISVG